MTSFRLRDTDKCDSVLFFDAIIFFLHGRRVQKVCGPAYDTRASSLAIGSERSRNSLQLGENVRVEEASVWNFFRRN